MPVTFRSSGPLAAPGAERRHLLLAVAAAAALRLAYIAVGTPVDWPDTRIYLQSGQELLAGRTLSSHLVMPLYPLFLAWVGWDAVPVVQALLSAATVPLVYGIAREAFGRRDVARWAAALMVIEPLSVFYANQRMSETLFAFVFCAALLALYRRRWRLGCVGLVLAVLVRPSVDLLAPLLVAAFCLREAAGRAAAVLAARRLAVYGLVYALLMAPWWLHNWSKYHQFVRLNLGDGIVLRMEHHPVFVARGFWAQLPAVAGEFADEPDPVQRNRLRRAAALDFIREDPLRYAALSLRRLGRYWSPMLDQSENATWLQRARWPFFAMGCVVYAGALAYVLQRRERKWRGIAPLLLAIGYLTAVHVAMNALVRYRAPIMPLVVVIAGAGWQRANPLRAAPPLAAASGLPSA